MLSLNTSAPKYLHSSPSEDTCQMTVFRPLASAAFRSTAPAGSAAPPPPASSPPSGEKAKLRMQPSCRRTAISSMCGTENSKARCAVVPTASNSSAPEAIARESTWPSTLICATCAEVLARQTVTMEL